jgi:NAD(P)-dependent dehydrogenase (short-subunit alcohol dehydrogenase family)
MTDELAMGGDDGAGARVLRGRTAVITGGSRNIGAAIAHAFARAGADLVLVARGEERLRSVAEEIEAATGRKATPAVADVSTAEGVAKIVETARAALPRVDVLVNNAADTGSSDGIDILELTDEHFERTFATNLLGPYRLARAFGQQMRASGGGSIVNVVAGPGFLPLTGYAPYGVTAAGLWCLTRYLAQECAPTIRVNAVCPGTISEPDEYRRYAREEVLPLVPMGRPGKPDEVAGAAVYLASDQASYTTGAVIMVNGGRHW